MVKQYSFGTMEFKIFFARLRHQQPKLLMQSRIYPRFHVVWIPSCKCCSEMETHQTRPLVLLREAAPPSADKLRTQKQNDLVTLQPRTHFLGTMNAHHSCFLHLVYQAHWPNTLEASKTFITKPKTKPKAFQLL